ncbi:histidine phosphatase family protein [Actinoplanes flavus]|uniref:Histidine phosphatase family protein n=1 Tax=Actinoplanes flavus TaxID=2820290 RepID=A0ABS3UIJ6_9ACTN|nr:histidine phosphatase family protein [Actinoplanes flavus]MBO3738590.1 histidine phosphatase family protein [Actinoplanes flavus]
MTRILLVRHAMPEIDPAVPARQWRLSPDGRAAARELAPLIPAAARFVASPEPKARETLAEIAGPAPVGVDAGFAEVRRPSGWTGGGEYRAAARAYLNGAEHDGWEPRDQVVARFGAAVDRHVAEGGTLVIGTHGLAGTLWLNSRSAFGWPAERLWAALRFPDLIEAAPDVRFLLAPKG